VAKEGLDGVIEIDSAGTHDYHVGKPPDPRAQETANSRGIDLSDLRARKARPEDFEYYDYVIAMDQDNYHGLYAICPRGYEQKIALFMDYAPQLNMKEVPDPYYGGPQGFEQVFDLVEAASCGLLNDIRQRYL
jgi:protein-tyrosine phosphatase